MAESPSKEEQILRMMKRVLTDIAKETYVRPGIKPPLSDKTILNIRDCLALIVAREKELCEQAGRPMNMRPVFADDPKAQPQNNPVVDLASIRKSKKEKSDNNNDED